MRGRPDALELSAVDAQFLCGCLIIFLHLWKIWSYISFQTGTEGNLAADYCSLLSSARVRVKETPLLPVLLCLH